VLDRMAGGVILRGNPGATAFHCRCKERQPSAVLPPESVERLRQLAEETHDRRAAQFLPRQAARR
jgi:hypothetical protein